MKPTGTPIQLSAEEQRKMQASLDKKFPMTEKVFRKLPPDIKLKFMDIEYWRRETEYQKSRLRSAKERLRAARITAAGLAVRADKANDERAAAERESDAALKKRMRNAAGIFTR